MASRKYGCIPDVPDHRDFKFKLVTPVTLPMVVDQSPRYANVYDQGNLGSCTANSILLDYDFARVEHFMEPLLGSRLQLYYNERRMEGTIKYDAGASIRDGIKSLAKDGVAPETEWPYLISKFAHKPAAKAVKDGKKHTIKLYQRLDDYKLSADEFLFNLMQCLAKGDGFTHGIAVYSSFESDAVTANGVVPMPDKSEQLLGYHAVKCLGYNAESEYFMYRNSWGKGWGENGHFYLPYAYVTNPDLCTDFWTIQAV